MKIFMPFALCWALMGSASSSASYEKWRNLDQTLFRALESQCLVRGAAEKKLDLHCSKSDLNMVRARFKMELAPGWRLGRIANPLELTAGEWIDQSIRGMTLHSPSCSTLDLKNAAFLALEHICRIPTEMRGVLLRNPTSFEIHCQKRVEAAVYVFELGKSMNCKVRSPRYSHKSLSDIRIHGTVKEFVESAEALVQ